MTLHSLVVLSTTTLKFLLTKSPQRPQIFPYMDSNIIHLTSMISGSRNIDQMGLQTLATSGPQNISPWPHLCPAMPVSPVFAIWEAFNAFKPLGTFLHGRVRGSACWETSNAIIPPPQRTSTHGTLRENRIQRDHVLAASQIPTLSACLFPHDLLVIPRIFLGSNFSETLRLLTYPTLVSNYFSHCVVCLEVILCTHVSLSWEVTPFPWVTKWVQSLRMDITLIYLGIKFFKIQMDQCDHYWSVVVFTFPFSSSWDDILCNYITMCGFSGNVLMSEKHDHTMIWGYF